MAFLKRPTGSSEQRWPNMKRGAPSPRRYITMRGSGVRDLQSYPKNENVPPNPWMKHGLTIYLDDPRRGTKDMDRRLD
jgi:hypothetical protein